MLMFLWWNLYTLVIYLFVCPVEDNEKGQGTFRTSLSGRKDVVNQCHLEPMAAQLVERLTES